MRYATAWYLRPVPTSDFKIYWDIAMGLAEGRGYVIGGVPSAFRPIGYPLLLSLVIRLFGPHWWYAVLVQVLMSTAIVAATYWFTRRLFGTSAGLAAAALTALMPDHVLWSTVLNSEIPA
ncbi:MAG TPA: glycosyltransferase family 39 protein, partial [Thermaerobacter sp.]